MVEQQLIMAAAQRPDVRPQAAELLAVPSVPGYRIELDLPTTYTRPPEGGPATPSNNVGRRSVQAPRTRRPDSKWSGRADVEVLRPFLVEFTALDVAGTLVLESLAFVYVGYLPRPAEWVDGVDDQPGKWRSGEWDSISDLGSLGTGITPSHLRKLSIPDLLRAVKYEALARGIRSNWAGVGGDGLLTTLQATADLYRPVKAKRSPQVGDDQLRSLAERRLQLDEERHPRPVAAIAEELGYNKSTVTERLNRATKAGWLERAPRGARRRAPGPQLIEARRLENKAQKGAEDG